MILWYQYELHFYLIIKICLINIIFLDNWTILLIIYTMYLQFIPIFDR